MSSKGKYLIGVTTAGMELTWLYAWAAFVLIASMNRSFPLPEAMAGFLLGALSARVHWIPGRGWRLFFIPVFQVIGFALAAAMILYDFSNQIYSFFSTVWLKDFFLQTRSAQEWMLLIIIGIFIIMLWIAGIRWALRSTDYFSISRRFDLGVAAFLALFLIKLLLVYKGGIHVRDPYSKMLIFPFFIFSLLALGLINHSIHAPKAFLSGFQGIGLVISFAVIVIGVGTAVFLWFLPYLTTAAEAGYSVLKTAAAPLGPVMVSLLRFLFAPRRIREDGAGTSAGGKEMEAVDVFQESGKDTFFQDLIGWILVIIVGLLALVLVCAGIWLLFKWLWNKYARAPENDVPQVSLREAVEKLWLAFVRLCLGIFGYLRGCTTAAQIFTATGRFGRRSGITRKPGETPMEYGTRLSRRFPRFRRRIDIIVNAYHCEVYANASLDDEHLQEARIALRWLCSPRHWPIRFASFFTPLKSIPVKGQENDVP